MRKSALLLAFGISALVIGVCVPNLCARQVKPDPIAGYKNWKRVTEKPIYMLPKVAMLCIGPVFWDADPSNPHVPNYFNVYVNSIGQVAMLTGKLAVFPVGSIIVKEKLAGKNSSQLKLLTVMIKREPGFDSAHSNWQYMTVDSTLKRRSFANSSRCLSCHTEQKADDYTYRNYVNAYIAGCPKSLDGPLGTWNRVVAPLTL